MDQLARREAHAAALGFAGEHICVAQKAGGEYRLRLLVDALRLA